nr:zonular occludens toxin domain-containing protein [uncultured Desulfuromonas sp.]
MIQMLFAEPRSGKTYYMVNYLLKFCEYDRLYREYILNSDVLVISNIKGLKVPHWDLKYCLSKKPVEEFFTYENFEQIQRSTGKNHVILLVDECYEYFPPNFRSAPVRKFMAMHGHLGLDVFLCAQGPDLMTREFRSCYEKAVQVLPRSKKMGPFLIYRHVDKAGNVMDTERIRPRQSVFAAYKSQERQEYNKPKSAVTKMALFILFFVVLAFGLFKFAIDQVQSRGGGSDQAAVIDAVPDDPQSPIDLSTGVPRIASAPGRIITKEQEPVSISLIGSIEKGGQVYLLTDYGRITDYVSYDLDYRYVLVRPDVAKRLGYRPDRGDTEPESSSFDFSSTDDFVQVSNEDERTPVDYRPSEAMLEEIAVDRSRRANLASFNKRVNQPLKFPEQMGYRQDL